MIIESISPRRRTTVPVALLMLAGVAVLAQAQAQATQLNRYGYPEKLAPRPTVAEITAQDLMTRLYIFADDSMQGRQYGRIGNMKGTTYIANELSKLGLEPAGVGGTYFQPIATLVQRRYTDRSTITVAPAQGGGAATTLALNTDFVPVPGGTAPRAINAAQVIFAGSADDPASGITAQQAQGKIVVFAPSAGQAAGRGGGRGAAGGRGGPPGDTPQQTPADRYPGAAAFMTVNLDETPAGRRAFINDPRAEAVGGGRGGRGGGGGGGAPATAAQDAPQANIRVTRAAAAQLFDASFETLRPGATGRTVTARLEFVQDTVNEWGRNVIGLVRGSDPALRGQYIVVSSHNDHIGYTAGAGTAVFSVLDHDSLKAFRDAQMLAQFNGDSLRSLPPGRAQELAAAINVDSLRRIRPARPDSINNGADDDGSGSMALLEIAEYLVNMPVKPKRSVLFVFHTGEEAGLLGARYFANNPTVPLDSIVANLNADMIGRGRADDHPRGGPNYLGVLGANRLSSQLAEIVWAANRLQPIPLRLDDIYDGNVTGLLGGAYNNLYNRSDHAAYAAKCIPIAFFFTGLHGDYHQRTDEPQYIDYPHYARITNYIKDVVLGIAEAPERPAVDKPCTPS